MPTIGKRLQRWKHDSPADWEDWRWQLQYSRRGDDALIALLYQQRDPIAWISHFRTEPHVGGTLEAQSRGEVSGLCLPRFVADISGASGKTPLQLMPTSIEE